MVKGLFLCRLKKKFKLLKSFLSLFFHSVIVYVLYKCWSVSFKTETLKCPLVSSYMYSSHICIYPLKLTDIVNSKIFTKTYKTSAQCIL